jgi:AraC-like DNA-binding protein
MTLNPFIRKALLYIDENIQSKITLNDLAAELNINPYYFSRIFKQALGESPISYVRKKQLIRAQELIENGEYPTQVFYKFGFSDYSSFYRAYKAFFKKSPSED